jgi:hypothetical protein
MTLHLVEVIIHSGCALPRDGESDACVHGPRVCAGSEHPIEHTSDDGKSSEPRNALKNLRR